MNHKEQITHFCNDLDALINRYRLEYQLPLASIIGVLQIKINTIVLDAYDEERQ